ncbi:MAG: phospholipid carrier-dependent glycosyltransferase [Leptolyngbya sp. PLA1]|nr:phospholipid carrier-dependent glycosyltransferase [Leptolyngbya sp. PLA1]
MPTSPAEDRATRWAPWMASPRAAWMLLGLATLARVVYLAWGCPYTLIEDEAHYWEWSRHLALSYYTKGPGVAWLIGASTGMFGDSEFAVRLPAAISSSIAGVFLALLARRAVQDPRAPFVTLVAWLIAPAFQTLGLTMTIDGPYLACWAIAAWAAWVAIVDRRPWGWAVFGAALGAGALCKYTILLALPGALVVAALAPARPHARVRTLLGISSGLLLFLLAVSPIIFWNQQEGWPTIRHLLGHLGLQGGDMPVTQGEGNGWHYNPLWTLSLVATQLALVGPVLLLATLGAWDAWKARRAHPEQWGRDRLLIAISLPILLFYFAVSFVAEPEGNWPLAGFVALLPLAARRVVVGLDDWHARLLAWRALPPPRPRRGVFVRRPETPTQVLWYAAVGLGLLVALVVPRLDLLARLPVLGPRIPVHRFTGADVMASHVEELRAALQSETGAEPFIMATHYGRASQLAFYLPGRPTVLCSSSLMREGRRTQYDYWVATNPATAPGLRGRPAVVVGSTLEEWQQVFDRVTLVGTLRGDGKRHRPAYLGYGFKGFPPGGLHTLPATRTPD